jgi:CRP/FNR family transcriptional regulator, cyclic AMP receptor protein
MRIKNLRRRQPDDRVDLLRRVPELADVRTSTLRRLVEEFDVLDVPAGTVLVSQGRQGTEAFIVVEGEADVTVSGSHVADVGGGTFIGEMSLLTHSPRNATVVARTPMRLLAIHPRAFSGLLMTEPVLVAAIAKQLAGRVRELELDPAVAPALAS